MTAGRLPRRLIVGATSAALLCGAVGFVPLLGSASATACPTWTDEAGDSGVGTPAGTEPTGLSADDDLDVVGTTVTVAGDGGLQVAVKVVKLDPVGPVNTPGDEFIVNFTAGAVATKVTLKRDALEETSGASVNGGTAVTGKVVFDDKTSTVTGTFTAADVKSSFGKPLAGVKLSGFETLAYGYTESPAGPGLGFPLTDEAPAPAALTYTDAGGCGDASGTPAPTDSASPSPTPAPTATPGGLYEQPRKGCAQYKDPTGDADPTGIGEFNEGSLDITQVNLRSPSGAVQVYVGLANPAEALFDLWSGRVYTVTMTVAGKAVALTAPGEGPATATVGGTASTDIKATAKVDEKSKSLVFTVPLEGLAKAVGSAINAGTAITGTSVLTEADSDLGPQEADTAAGTTPAEKTYAYGDNTCFLPPAGVLELDADPSGQYGDRTTLFATLKDVDDAPVQGVKVSAKLGSGKAVSATTDEDGVAALLVPLTLRSGTYALTVAWAGDDVVGPAKATRSFKVVAEKTVLKAVAIRGGAKATVLDDDKHPVVGRPVTFLVSGKKRVVKTSTKGIAVLTGVAKGTAVKVSFPAVPGYYLGTPTYTVKAL